MTLQPIPIASQHLVNNNAEKFFRVERDGLTQGALVRWMVCPEKARLSLVNGYRSPDRKDAIEFGNIVHENLEYVYGAFEDSIKQDCPYDLSTIMQIAERKLRSQEMVAQSAVRNDADAEASMTQYSIASEILQLYYVHWKRDFTDVRWVGLETEFSVPYFWRGFEFPLRGKIDGIVRQTKGNQKLWLFDSKTKSSIDEPSMIPRLGYDFQMGLYMYAMRQLYHELPQGLVYNLIKRPQLRRKVKESITEFAQRCGEDARSRMDEYFKRIEVIWTQDDFDKFDADLHATIDGFMTWYTTGQMHYRNSASCHNGMWKCEFIPICAYGHTEAFVQSERPYPELGTE